MEWRDVLEERTGGWGDRVTADLEVTGINTPPLASGAHIPTVCERLYHHRRLRRAVILRTLYSIR